MSTLSDAFVPAAMAIIEAYDPTVAGHSQRVAILTVGIAERAHAAGKGPLRDLHFSPDQLQAIRYASLLHDIGMIGVPRQILLKATKLYASNMRLIEVRFALAKRCLEAENLRAQLGQLRSGPATEDSLAEMDRADEQEQEELDGLLQAVRDANEPFHFEADTSVLTALSRRSYADANGSRQPLLTPEELAALSIPMGCLSREERSRVEAHASEGLRILSAVQWTGVYGRIPEIVYAHHEKMDGSGYPRGLSAAEIPIESRMMAIADTFDALVAPDRPHKRTVSPERGLDILQSEAKQGKLDAQVLQLFTEVIHD